MNKDTVRKTEAFLKEKFDGSRFFSANPKAKAYRLEHTYRVANIGLAIAKSEGFDETETVVACLLHDVSYCEDFGENGWIEHGRRASAIARPFLESLGMPEDRIADICYGIAIHVDDEADFPGERTAFALSVGDADNIDRFDAYRIFENLSRDRFGDIGFDEKLDYVGKRIDRLNELMDMELGTKTAEKLWKERIAFNVSFFKRLRDQLLSSKTIVGV